MFKPRWRRRAGLKLYVSEHCFRLARYLNLIMLETKQIVENFLFSYEKRQTSPCGV